MKPSKLSEDLKRRIRALEEMSPQNWREALQVLTDQARAGAEIQPSNLVALQVRSSYDLATAVHAMDRTSTALARKACSSHLDSRDLHTCFAARALGSRLASAQGQAS